MITLKQRRDGEVYVFDVQGYRNEVFHMQKWLAHYEYGDSITVQRETIKPDDTLSIVKAVVRFEKQPVDIALLDFVSMFKLAYHTFTLPLPDASNTLSKFMQKLDRLGDMANAVKDAGVDLDSDMVKEIRTAMDEETENDQ